MIDDDVIERTARSIHENFLREQQADGVALGSAPAMQLWSALTDELRDSNRDQARAIMAKLAAVGAVIVTAGPGNPPFEFTPTELEDLARQEHDRFTRRRIDAGWHLGSPRDDAAKIHPTLVAWEELSEVERDKDRDAVRNIPAVLARVGLAACRAGDGSGPLDGARHRAGGVSPAARGRRGPSSG